MRRSVYKLIQAECGCQSDRRRASRDIDLIVEQLEKSRARTKAGHFGYPIVIRQSIVLEVPQFPPDFKVTPVFNGSDSTESPTEIVNRLDPIAHLLAATS